jgi:prohibitin 1
MKKLMVFIGIAAFCSSCFIVRPGEVGLKRRLGKLVDKTYGPGVHGVNPFITAVIKVPITTTNVENQETLPTKEGLNVRAEFAILYRLKPDYAKVIIETIGLDYEYPIILSVLKSVAPNVTASYYAKDLYTSERAAIGREITAEMTKIIGDRGIVIEAVLLKTIKLPDGLSKSIEQKLEAEQDAQRMEFVLNKEKKEAERKIIEAEGIKKSQIIIAEGLSPMIIQYKSLDVFNKLANSPNAKVIISNGKAPFLINAGDEAK